MSANWCNGCRWDFSSDGCCGRLSKHAQLSGARLSSLLKPGMPCLTGRSLEGIRALPIARLRPEPVAMMPLERRM